jgi:predicted nucleotidyltransferase
MVEFDDIQKTVNDIVRQCAPFKIILFGSYAYGAPNEDSDVDLCVIAPGSDAELRTIGENLYVNVPRRFRRDIVVYAPEDVAYRTAHNDWFLLEILNRGRVLYESAHAGVGR